MSKDIIPTVKQRIDNLMRAKGLKRYSLAEKAGISNPTIQNWYTKRNYQPSLDSIIKVSEALEISPSQLFLAEDEEMYPINSELKELFETYQMLNKEEKQLVLQMVKKLKKD